MDANTKKILIGAGVGASTATILYFIFKKKHPPLTNDSEKNANQIGIDLGTAYPFLDPRHWTENDQAAENLISSIPVSQMPQLSADYRKLFSRDLVSDLQKYLSGWENVKHKFVTGGGALNKSIGMIKIKRGGINSALNKIR